MGAWGKIRFEVKEKEIKDGGEMKTKTMIRLIKTFGRRENGQMGYTPMRKDKEGRI